jgi:hypothetical protein
MNKFHRLYIARLQALVLLIVLLQTGWATAQAQSSRTSMARPQGGATSPAFSDERTLNETRQELRRLLKMTPTLTSVVAHDPSL